MSNPLDYTIGWICAISTEYVAARAFLDSVHDPPSHVAPHDSNEYTLGRMGKHNVVIAVLPDGEYGLSTASAVAKGMLNSFPHVRAGLMVGIAGGAPTRNPGRDIRLGDVVVSSPRDGHGGVFQYDFGKLIQGQSFKPSRILNQPPDVLRAAVAGLKAEFEERGHTIIEDIEEALKKRPKLRSKYSRPSPETDRLFLSHVTLNPNNPIDNPGPELLVSRKLRTTDEDDPAVFYGLIASANQLMKDANMRDQLATDRGVLCFEMEAAGLMNHFPCLVIRGICDYSDSHKNKDWQGYAAMTAAAYAKALVCRVQRTRLENEPKLTTLISQMKMVKRDIAKVKYQMENQVDNRILDRLSIADEAEYDSHFNQHEPKCHPETRISLLKRIETWAKDRRDQRIYWLSGSAGTGKSTISRTVAKHFDDEKLLAATFFFKRGVASCSKASLLFSTVSRQLARRRPEAQQFILRAITKADNISSKGIAVQFKNLVLNPLERTYAEISFKEVYKTRFREVYWKAFSASFSGPLSSDPESSNSESSNSASSDTEKEKLEKDMERLFEQNYKMILETSLRRDHEREQELRSKNTPKGEVTTRTVGSRLLREEECKAQAAKIRAPKEAFEKARKKALEEARKEALDEACNTQLWDKGPETLILVLDALDECSVDEDIETFVPLLAELASSRTCNLKVFVTSRPEVAIRYTLGPVKELLRVKLHEIEPHVVSQDIMVFLRDSLSEIRERWNKRKSTDPSQQLEASWPGTRKLQALADMADRLFIFAATTCRFIADPLYSPEKQLSRVLKTAMESGINDRLTPTYLPVLWQFKTGRSKRETDILLGRFRRVVGTLVLLQEPLPIASIAGLVATDEIDVDHILDSLSSVIDIPEDRRSAVKPFHLSFRDFLLGPEAGDFALDFRKTHQNIAVDCLDLLTKRQPLHYNMCNIWPGDHRSELTEEVRKAHIPLHVQYACLNWVDHLMQAHHVLEDNDISHQFLQGHLVHWFEALSIMRKFHRAEEMLSQLLRFANTLHSRKYHQFIEDSMEFLDFQKSTSSSGSELWGYDDSYLNFERYAPEADFQPRKLAEFPLQIYWSGLVFSPIGNRVRGAFGDLLSQLIVGPRTMGHPEVAVQQNPPVIKENLSVYMELDISKTETAEIGNCFIVVSKGEEYVLSIDKFGKAALWSPMTGQLIRVIEGFEGEVVPRGIRMAHDGGLMFIPTSDGSRYLWSLMDADLRSPKKLQAPADRFCDFQPHGAWNACFSSDSASIATCSLKELSLWTKKGERILRDCAGFALPSCAASTNGNLAAYTAGEPSGTGSQIRVLNITEMTYTDLPLQGAQTLALAISPDSTWIALLTTDAILGSKRCKVSLWGVHTGSERTLLERVPIRGTVTSLEFSPSSQKLALVDTNGLIYLWSIPSGQCLALLRIDRWIERVAFSSDESFLITEHGKISIPDVRPHISWDCGEPTDMIGVVRVPQWHGLGINHSGQWITWNGHNLIALPSNQECSVQDGNLSSYNTAVGDSCIAWVTAKSKRLSVLAFPLDANPSKHLKKPSLASLWDITRGRDSEIASGYR
ncbi:hypothetical protein LZ32DRAFT_587227 [Colletotrichum eremochloae]|nr:hypothetical protein LZ32DRAFT_587227 [Colletotrichum eremochloae]